jgi:7-cyano-7-deazaguanine synthase
MKKVLLYSGGMDSWLISKLWKPDICLYIDMQTRYSQEEIQRLPSYVIKESLPLNKWERDDLIIPLRNVFLVCLATNYGEEICLGATAGDRVLDKSIDFANKLTDLINYLYLPQHWTSGKTFIINLDYKNKTKTKLLLDFINQGGDINKAFNESFSCYQPVNHKECWMCKPCIRKFVAFYCNGFQFSQEIKHKTLPMLMQIYPQILHGAYNRKEEEQDIMDVLKKEQCIS